VGEGVAAAHLAEAEAAGEVVDMSSLSQVAQEAEQTSTVAAHSSSLTSATPTQPPPGGVHHRRQQQQRKQHQQHPSINVNSSVNATESCQQTQPKGNSQQQQQVPGHTEKNVGI